MATVFDVARYILDQRGSMTAMKLQKLAYYSKAWHMVWDDKILFPQHFEAWANGPVAPSLYAEHRGQFQVTAQDIDGSPANLSADERESVDAVIEFYADRSAMELSELTHMEAPWREARGNLPLGARSQARIEDSALAEYYGSLV